MEERDKKNGDLCVVAGHRDGGTVKAEFRSLPSSSDLSKNPILFGFPLPKLCEQPDSWWSSGTTTDDRQAGSQSTTLPLACVWIMDITGVPRFSMPASG